MPIPQLPFDVLSEVLTHVFQSYNIPSLPSRPSTPSKRTTSLLLVSKAFHELTLPFLYQSISIGRSSEDWELFFAPSTGLFVGDGEGKTRRSWVRELRLFAGTPVVPLDLEDIEISLLEDGLDPFAISDCMVEMCGKVSFPNLRSVGIIPGTSSGRRLEKGDLVKLFRAHAETEDLVLERDENGDPCYCYECVLGHYVDVFNGIETKRANFILQLLLPSLPHLTTISLSISNCASPHVFEDYILQTLLHPSCRATLRLHYSMEPEVKDRSASDQRQSAVAHLEGLHDVLPFDANVQVVGFGRKTKKMIRKAVKQRKGGGDLAKWEFVSSSEVEAFLEEL